MANVVSEHDQDDGGDPVVSLGKRLSSQCEQSSQLTDSVPTKKTRSVKTRGKSMGLKMRNIWITNGKNRFPIEFDAIGKSWLPIGENQGDYVRTVGNKIREVVIPCYKNWASVPEDQQKRVFFLVEVFFDLRGTLDDDDYKKVLKSYDHTAAKRYSCYKSTAHMHYKAQQKNPSIKKTYRDLTTEDWQKCIDLFASEEFTNRSIKNSANRGKQRYPCYQGSKSLVAHHVAFERANARTGDEIRDESDAWEWTPSFIELFQQKHTKNGRWRSDEAKSDYLRLLDARDAFISASPEAFVDERAIMREVLGARRGHERGVGRTLKGSGTFGIYDMPESSTAGCGSVPKVSILMKELEKMSKMIARLKAKVGIEDEVEDEVDHAELSRDMDLHDRSS